MSTQKQSALFDNKYLPKGMSANEFVSGYAKHQYDKSKLGVGDTVDKAKNWAGSKLQDYFGPDATGQAISNAFQKVKGYDPRDYLGEGLRHIGNMSRKFTGQDFNFRKQLWSSFKNEDDSIDWDRAAPVINAFMDEDFRNKVSRTFEGLGSGGQGDSNFSFKNLANAASGGQSKFNVGNFLNKYIDPEEGFQRDKFLDTTRNLRNTVDQFRQMGPGVRKHIMGLREYTNQGNTSFVDSPDKTLNQVSQRLSEFGKAYRGLGKDTQKGIQRSVRYLNRGTGRDSSPSDRYAGWIKNKVQEMQDKKNGGGKWTDSLSTLPMITNFVETADTLGMDPSDLELIYERTKGLGTGSEDLGEFSNQLRDRVSNMDETRRKDFSSDLRNVLDASTNMGISSDQVGDLVGAYGADTSDMQPNKVIEAIDRADAMLGHLDPNERESAGRALNTITKSENKELLSAFLGGPASEVMNNIDEPEELSNFLSQGSKLINAAEDMDINLSDSYDTLQKASTFIGGKKGEGMSPSQMMDVVMGEDGEVDRTKLEGVVEIGDKLNRMHERLDKDKMRKYLGVAGDEDITLQDLGIDPSFFMEGDGGADFNVAALNNGMDLMNGVITEFEEGNLNPEIVRNAIGSVNNLAKLGVLGGPGKGGIQRIKTLVSDGEGGVNSDRLSNVMKFLAVGNRVWESLKSGDPEAWAALGGIGLTLAGLFSRIFGGGASRRQQRQPQGYSQGFGGRGYQQPILPQQRQQPIQRQPSRSGRIMYPVDWRSMPGRTIR